MKNLLLKNAFLDNKEQAAGFPPFSRGYEAFNFTPKIITPRHLVNFDFVLQAHSEEAILKLFKEILSNDVLKPSIQLFLDFPVNEQLIITARLLRTLLALIGHLKYNQASISKFCFYTNSSNSPNILIEYQYVFASQINFFICDENYFTFIQNHPRSPIPVDALYGSEIVNEEMNRLFNPIWTKIYSVLNRSE